ncbi:uncharacterized protein AKAW2_50390S [Aspergillus luchuensis]|uniref:Uncharacterized protein n=1 Tax=Aspergillus kawachii TaxID=1069201 RepID=A0A7R7WBU7_ASPKA|nr:uncharacterized protein AKAW2_50390S [Aspergillus luchuensis]BCS00049.1 hypothetical protein AKAW2_50390S [Aspergillus luchuensis]
MATGWRSVLSNCPGRQFQIIAPESRSPNTRVFLGRQDLSLIRMTAPLSPSVPIFWVLKDSCASDFVINSCIKLPCVSRFVVVPASTPILCSPDRGTRVDL